MSSSPSPFRSEAEQIRELLRRAEEKQQVLLDERTELVHQVGTRKRRRASTIALLIMALSTTSAAYAGGKILANRTVARETAAEQQYDDNIARSYTTGVDKCTAENEELTGDISKCNQDVAKMKQLVAAAAAAEPCTCKRTDAFCSCWHDPPFNQAEADASLRNVRAHIACIQPRRSVTFLAHVTFALDGKVEFVSIEEHELVLSVSSRLSVQETRCIEKALRSQAHVPPFSGARVMVQQLYDVSP